MKKFVVLILVLGFFLNMVLHASAEMVTIHNNTVWNDTDGNEIMCQGGGVIYVDGVFHWFGMDFSSNYDFIGINHYTSTDLKNWTKQSPVVTAENAPFQRNQWVGRPYVIYCPNSDPEEYRFVLICEWGSTGQPSGKDGSRNRICFFTAKDINGPYTFREDKTIWNLPDVNGDRWSIGDLGVYQEGNRAFLLYTFDKPIPSKPTERNYSQAILELAPNFLEPLPLVDGKPQNYVEFHGKDWPEGVQEAASIFKYGDTYYYLTSKCAGWPSSETRYRTAKDILGPWSDNAIIPGTLETKSYDTQHDFEIIVNGTERTTVIYCGDRWQFTMQTKPGKYAWYPLTIDENGVPHIHGYETWQIDAETGLFQDGGPSPTPDPRITPTPTPGPVFLGDNVLENPGFETGDITGWQAQGPCADRFATNKGGRDNLSEYKINSTKGSSNLDYTAWQTVENIPNGKYKFSAWTQSDYNDDTGEFEASVTLFVKDHGGEEIQVEAKENPWGKTTVEFEVTTGKATVGFKVFGKPGSWVNIDDCDLRYVFQPGENVLRNSDFERGDLHRWTAEASDEGIVKAGVSGNNGSAYKLDISKNSSYNAHVYQTVTDIPNGIYRLSAYTQANRVTTFRMYVKDYGGDEKIIDIPVKTGWSQTVMDEDIVVTDGKCTVGFIVYYNASSSSNGWVNIDDVELVLQSAEQPEEPEEQIFEIDAPVITGLDGNTVDFLSPSEFIMINVNIENVSQNSSPAALIVALYDDNDAMVNIGLVEKQMAPGEKAILKTGFKLPADVAGHKIKIFVWDSIKGMKPLSDVITFD